MSSGEVGSMQYDVIATHHKEQGYWTARVPAVPGAHTHAPNRRDLERDIRNVIVLMAGLPEAAREQIEIRLTISTGDADLDDQLAAVRAKRAKVEELSSTVATETAGMSKLLRTKGYSFREIGAMLGISPQRVQQVT